MMKINFLQRLIKLFSKPKKPFSDRLFIKNKFKKFFEIGTLKIKE